MGNRYADDIKRIVGIDPNQSTLGDAEEKGAIGGKRGIGYVNASSGGVEGESGAPGDKQKSTKKKGDSKSNGEDAGTSPLDPANPQNGVISPTDGVYAAADIIDGLSPASKESSPATTDGGLEYDGSLALNAFTAVDCSAGTGIEVRLRNDFVPPDAVEDSNGVEGHSDWEDADTPPALIGWDSGKEWGTGFTPTAPFFSTPQGVADYLTSVVEQTSIIISAFWASGANPIDGGFWTIFHDLEGVPPGTQVDTFVASQSCTPDAESTSCPVTAPTETAWPTSGQYVLRAGGGQFTANQYDSEAPVGATNPSSKVDFCFGDEAARTGTVEATRNNGYMLYETSGGNPTGIVRAYDSTGQMVAAFDTSFIDNYRPTPTP